MGIVTRPEHNYHYLRCAYMRSTIAPYLISSTAYLSSSGLSLSVDVSCLDFDDSLFIQRRRVQIHLCQRQTAGSTRHQLGLGIGLLAVRAKTTAPCMCTLYHGLLTIIIIPSIAQLEERETVIGNIRAHLKVTGSIPVRGISFDVFGSTH
jgi:hypothetical protein